MKQTHTRVSEYIDKITNLKYWLKIDKSENWLIYEFRGNNPDYSDPITNLSSLKKSVRDWAKTEIKRHKENIRADKAKLS